MELVWSPTIGDYDWLTITHYSSNAVGRAQVDSNHQASAPFVSLGFAQLT